MSSSLHLGTRLNFLSRQGIALALALAAIGLARAQDPVASPLGAPSSSPKSKKEQAHRAADKDAVPPSLAIPVGPLGFAPPAAFYLGDRFSQASLDFLDEDTLLFTFRVPGLIAREPATPSQPQQDERHIRALTISLPEGKVTAESIWVLHDYNRYLWVLKNGKFLVRDRNTLEIGNASLHLEPFLRFPGLVSFIEFAPDQELLVTNTNEPPAPELKAGAKDEPASDPGSPPSTASAAASMGGRFDLDFQKLQSSSQSLVRIFSMQNRKVMLFSRVNGTVHLPVDGEGYYEALRGNESKWMVNFEHFQGASTPLGWVESACNPTLDALAPGIVLASACTGNGARRLTALARNRDKEHARLWDVSIPSTKVWPILATSADGSRLARATLEVTHPIGPSNPLDDSDIRGQSIQVYDLADGKVELTVSATPILDAGGNFALSPSGQRFAVLNAGAIQVFDLPPAPAIPPLETSKTILAKP
jgi:hypothetical protein